MKEKKLLGKAAREFNIISNKYSKDNDERYLNEKYAILENIDNRLKKTRKFNIVTATFYDKNKEDDYQNNFAQTSKEWGKDFNKRFPPSWKYRENLVIDPTKEISEEVEIVQKKKIESKKRYKAKFSIEKEINVELFCNSGMRSN